MKKYSRAGGKKHIGAILFLLEVSANSAFQNKGIGGQQVAVLYRPSSAVCTCVFALVVQKDFGTGLSSSLNCLLISSLFSFTKS